MGVFDRFKKKEEQAKQIDEEVRYGCLDKMDYQYETALHKYLESYDKKVDELTDEDFYKIQCCAANHIGFFLTWIIKHHFEGDVHKEDTDALEAVRKEEMLGVDFFLKYCDGKFWGEDLSDDIFPFVSFYYDNYLVDYSKWVVEELCDLPLEFIGTWEDYHQFEHVLDDAYKQYKI